MDSNNFPPFDPRVQDQLQRRRNHSYSSQSSNAPSHSSYHSAQSTHIHPHNPRYSRTSRHHTAFQPQPPPGLDAFPPLASSQSVNTPIMPQPFYDARQYQYNGMQQSAAHDFFTRSRGRGRSRGNRQSVNTQSTAPVNDYSRPPSTRGQRLYNPRSAPHFTNIDQQRMSQQRVMEQSDYLNNIAGRCSSNMLSREEIARKEAFAIRLQTFAAHVVQDHSTETTQSEVRLQPYGSLANSFGIGGCDVDLLLTIRPPNGPYLDVSDQVKRGLEKALLDHGIGARLLTNTRVPIMRVCEKPNPELLRNLREHRAAWEKGVEESTAPTEKYHGFGPLPSRSSAQDAKQAIAAAELVDYAAEVPLPDSPLPDHAKLEYVGDCGIQCDINFTNHIALINSKLLWTYGQCDPRVRHVGIFVKTWAKSRDINTPYKGTLSSYGYILMVLHYLMNVAHPPLIPNLQEMARTDGWEPTPVELLEGHDVRFIKGDAEVRSVQANMQRNNSSLGALLAGFFRYYGSPQAGFRWTDQVVSIRTPGGIVTKHDKDWIRAKWSEENPNVRQRYLLAIEDPFEIEHNVGRTVGHNGLVAIRDEFRRAWVMIEDVRCIRAPQGPIWAIDPANNASLDDPTEFLKPITNRGDLLRKDADGRREKAEKARKMRQELEIQEEVAKKQALEGRDNAQEADDVNGTWKGRDPHPETRPNEIEETSWLIQNHQHQDEKTSRMRSRNTMRTRLDDEDDDQSEDGYFHLGLTEHVSSGRSVADPRSARQFEADSNDAWGYSAGKSTEHEISQDGEAEPNRREIPADMAWSQWGPVLSDKYTNTLGSPDNVHLLATQVYKVDQTSPAVGPHIQWTKDSIAGLWLRKRDAWVRAGTFKAPTAADTGRLHAAFPYDPNMSKQQLADKNRILEHYYRVTMYKKIPEDQDSNTSEAEKVVLDTTRNSANDGWGSAETIEDSLVYDVSEQTWPVGRDIPWSAETGAGRWLQWRDRKHRMGTWQGAGKRWSGLAPKLDALFPYNSEKTLANVDRMNTELATFFKDLEFPRPDEGTKSQQYASAHAMHAAIERTLDFRQSTHSAQEANERTFAEVYNAMGQPAAEAERTTAAALITTEQTTSHPVVYDPDSSWTLENDIGSWLHRRDELINNGTWQEGLREESVFKHISELYPYNPHISLAERVKQNKEIEICFPSIYLPRGEGQAADDAWTGILKVLQYRKSDVEAEHNEKEAELKAAEATRIRHLLDMFQDDTVHGPVRAPASSSQTPRSSKREPTSDQESLQALQAVAERVSRPREDAVNDVVEHVRQQRLAFFDRLGKDQENMALHEGARPDVEGRVRRDSAAEGSWNDIPSPLQGAHPHSPVFNSSANSKKPADQSFLPPRDPDASPVPFSRHCNHVTTDERGDEHNAKTLEPDTWRTHHRYGTEDPCMIPAIRNLNFELDPRQLIDINTIRAGGNGCVRGGPSPYLLESDEYSWGGGGAMGQRSRSSKWSVDGQIKEWWSKTSSDKAIDRELAQELPGFVDL